MITLIAHHIELVATVAVVATAVWVFFPETRVSPWRFWDPRSGIRGGTVMGVLVVLCVLFLTGCPSPEHLDALH